MGKFFSWLVGADVQKTIDTVASGIDMAIYTDEEKAIVANKIIDAKIEAVGKQSIARRIIAVAITFNALVLVNVAVGLQLAGMITQAEFVLAILTGFLLNPFLAVVGFYFLVQFAKK